MYKRKMDDGGVSRPCLLEHVKPLVSVDMNIYGNNFREGSAFKYRTSLIYEFSSPSGRSDASRSVEKLIFR